MRGLARKRSMPYRVELCQGPLWEDWYNDKDGGWLTDREYCQREDLVTSMADLRVMVNETYPPRRRGNVVPFR
jgi:hypothetical protein